ncbi:MAG TPA: IPT/TIG domain-containing protein, partial [Solirubrobacter sp.]
TITCATPPHGAGGASVVVTNPDGQASTAAVQFTFVDAPSISSIDPGIVPTAGGAAVVIQGSAFASPARAFFGGVEATGTTVVSTTQIAATVPPHAAGAVDVIVQNPDGQQATLASAISYSDAPPPPPAASPPTLASLSPSSGLDSGGTPVTLTGTNFDATVTVTFGGAPATVISVTPTTLGVVTPVHADGAVDVAVTNAAGQATLAGAYTYLAPPPVTPPPVLSAVSPAQGPVTGGTSVTLTGSAFDRPTVTFGGVLASVLSSSATSITAVAPPSPAGPVAVTVTNFDGQSSTQAAAFTFTAAPPVVTGLSPSTGTAGAATPLTITGTGFVAGATVAFGGTPATGVIVQSATSITATSPALPAGTVNVAVTNPDAQVSAASNASAFTFAPGGGLPAPVISSIDPTTAVFTGGQPFTLTGSNFLGGATVTVGGVAALNVIVGNTGLSITGTIPAGAPGPAAVVVRNVDGQSAAFNGFSYVNPPPVILALNVEGAPFAGGAIFIAGTGFAATATVTFGGVPSPSVVQDPNTGGLTVAVPAFTGTPDPVRGDAFVPLVVTNPDNQSATWSKQFHYGPPPSVTSLANPPPGGGLAVVKKGDAITITGVNFSADTTGIRAGLQVLVAGTVATITSKSPTQIVFTAPKANPGTYPVSVTNFDKQNTITTFPNLLTYPGP